MPFTMISADRFTASHSFVFNLPDADALVLRGVTVAASNGVGLYASNVDHDLTVLGQVAGDAAGVRLGNSATDQNNTLVIGESGLVAGDLTGVAVMGRTASVVNRGEIYGNGSGMELSATGTGGLVVVRNWGLVTGDVGVLVDPASTSTVRFYNNGTLSGDEVAYQGGNGVDQFWNSGELNGDVLLGGGNDRFEGYVWTSFGQILIDGGAGNDGFILRNNSFDENAVVFDGGSGFDTLDLRPANGVRGLVLGEDALRFERVIGGRYYDEITGDGFANTIEGREGGDSLDGGGGADTIIGGAENDQMAGGTGNDTFRFNGPGDASDYTFYRDVIVDWSNTATDDDRLQIDASGYGGGLPLGTLSATRFQSRLDNVAQDADDRFIFETDDRILWFDVDGNGAAAPIAIAQFGGTAPVTEADIFVVA